MDAVQLSRSRQIIKDNPWLIWYTKNYDQLDEEAITEAVLSNGSWGQFLDLKNIAGIKELRLIFKKLTAKRRVNLRPETVNFFNLYFAKHASGNSNLKLVSSKSR